MLLLPLCCTAAIIQPTEFVMDMLQQHNLVGLLSASTWGVKTNL